MNKIKRFLRVSELDTLAATIVRQYQAAASESEALAKDEHLSGLMSELGTLSHNLTLAIKRDRTKSTLAKANATRNKIIRDFSDLLTGYAAIPFDDMKAAGGRLLSIFKKYGRLITKKSYAEGSSLIKSMLGDFSKESAKVDAKLLLGVEELLSSLRSAQEDFLVANDAFIAAIKEKGECASAIKQQLVYFINSRLIPFLSSIDRNSAFTNFIGQCTIEIARANSTASMRSKSAASEPAENDESSAESEEENPQE